MYFYIFFITNNNFNSLIHFAVTHSPDSIEIIINEYINCEHIQNSNNNNFEDFISSLEIILKQKKCNFLYIKR